MTIGSSMSSGYCSLDEDLEDCFFTAKTSFFRSAQSKVPAKGGLGAGMCTFGLLAAGTIPTCVIAARNVTQTVEEEKPEPPTVQEIKQRIEKYNAKVTNCLLMKLWDAFSIPELQNFLMILDKEEKDKIQQVHRKYERFKQRLQQTLKEARGKPG
ncbi:hypothetical protein BTVI_24557 [Pitangus sulphuratus]|nr:hypothetical protein BTVI_24557 [Pitangus sulphuratus]